MEAERMRQLLDQLHRQVSRLTAATPAEAEALEQVKVVLDDLRMAQRELHRRGAEQRRRETELRALNDRLEKQVREGEADLREARRIGADWVRRERAARRAAERSEAQSRHVQKLESIGVLAGGIAHDFNNLLHVVLGNADFARARLSEGSPARDALDEVVSATLRAADLTRQLLAYSGQESFVIRPLNLSHEVRELATLLRTVISKQATVVWELAERLPAVRGDATQIRQVVMNLLTNASDALGEAPGTITLRTGVGRPEDEPGDRMYAFLEVADTGCGMGSDTLQRIFDPFFSTKYAGRGLGLAAVMGIVDGHHGRIRIRTAVGEGTRFRIYLPTVTAAAAAGSQPTRSSTWRGSGLVLVVDDEDSVRDLAQRMLRSLGFETLAATNGREALGIMARRAGEVAVVLIDLSMPRISGPETVRRLRELRPELPVILMSGYAESSAIPRLSEVDPQVTTFLQKPFLLDDLATALRSVLEPGSPASPTSVGTDR